MNDPHVEALHYTVVHSQFLDYDTAPPLEVENDAFFVCVAGHHAVFRMKAHYPTEETAKHAVVNFIQAWEVCAGLQYGPDEFKLSFGAAEIVDRNPSPGTNAVALHETIAAHVDAIVHKRTASYPAAPQAFSVSPEVELMYARYTLYRQGRTHVVRCVLFLLLRNFNGGMRRRRRGGHAIQCQQGTAATIKDIIFQEGWPKARRGATLLD